MKTEPLNKPDPAASPTTGRITYNTFTPPFWAKNPHVQTLWSTVVKRRPDVSFRRERFDLADGDFVDLDWCAEHQNGPLIVIIHGLEGSSDSAYARGLSKLLSRHQCAAGVLHFRGCSGEPNRSLRAYHSGEINDLSQVLDQLMARYPARPVIGIGYSIGGSVLLNYLGRKGQASRFDFGIAVSVPYLLGDCADRLTKGLAKLYQNHLVSSLKRNAIERLSGRQNHSIDLAAVARCKTFWDFDDLVTAPLHGFSGVNDYYQQCSSKQWLKHITTPTLLIHAIDDPFMFRRTCPTAEDLSPSVELCLNQHGGHVGFIQGSPLAPRYWLEHHIVDALKERFLLRPTAQ